MSQPLTHSADYLLSFLISHDLKEAKEFFGGCLFEVANEPTISTRSFGGGGVNAEEALPIEKAVNDFPSTITLNDKGDLNVSINVKYEGRQFSSSKLTYRIPGTKFQNLSNEKGTLYVRGGAPSAGTNTVWVQQYPPVSGQGVGRTVVEFYTDQKITAVFKTNTDNYGGTGNGVWN